ncbi:hypothetical protein ACNS7O_04880 [Haloferacaceae archaeon DSL9]
MRSEETESAGDRFEPGRYDALVASIPVPPVAGWAVAAQSASASAYGAGIGAMAGLLLVGYCLFAASPVESSDADGG